MSISTIPELRRPPHDPLTLLLGGRLGWPVAPSLPGSEPVPATQDGWLRLPRHAGSLRALTEPSGSFGGLRAPANVAVSDDGVVWLVPPGGPRLLRFDPCECGVEQVSCFGEEGSAPGQLRRPGGIAVAAGHLFVCDTGNQRVQVVLTPQLVVSRVLAAPLEWEPTDVAVDGRFRVHVADPANGMLHHFGWSGRYLGHTAGLGACRFVAVGADGALYVAGNVPQAGAYRIDADGTVVALTEPADELVAAFPPAPFEVAPDGSMHLGPWCRPPSDAWFSPAGEPVPAPPPPRQLYERSASAVIGPLDSLIDECVWHRVVLRGDLPRGCSVGLDTVTSQVPLSATEVADLPEQAWETRLSATSFDDDGWDALVRSPAGRYLWLRVRLVGNGLRTPRVDEALVEFPRISLRRFLPGVYGAEPTSADFTDRLLAIVDRSLRGVEERIDEVPALLDPHATDHLAWLASFVGMRLDRRLPERLQRDLLADSDHLLDLRGTVAGLRRLLTVALGLDALTCDRERSCVTCPEPRQTCPPRPVEATSYDAPPLVLEHFRLRRWFEAGASTLGDTTVLWGESIVRRSQLGRSAQVGATGLKGTQDPLRDPFHVHAHRFTVFVPASAGRTPERRRAVEQLVDWGSPAHTLGHVEYVDARLRIGVQSSIGLDTVVARMPAGVTLGSTELGPASVLSGTERPSLDTSAVGATTRLR